MVILVYLSKKIVKKNLEFDFMKKIENFAKFQTGLRQIPMHWFFIIFTCALPLTVSGNEVFHFFSLNFFLRFDSPPCTFDFWKKVFCLKKVGAERCDLLFVAGRRIMKSRNMAICSEKKQFPIIKIFKTGWQNCPPDPNRVKIETYIYFCKFVVLVNHPIFQRIFWCYIFITLTFRIRPLPQ